MAHVNLHHPVLIQRENGATLQFHAGEGQFVPDDLAEHPRILAAMAGDDNAGPTEEDQSDNSGPATSKDELIKMADELGIQIDRRWGTDRIRAAIEAA